MNICVVSSFEGNVEEFMSLVSELDEEIKLYTSDFEIGVVNSNKAGTSKVITYGKRHRYGRLSENYVLT